MIKYTIYTKKENQIITKLYPTKSAKFIATKINRSTKAINRQAWLLNIKKINR